VGALSVQSNLIEGTKAILDASFVMMDESFSIWKDRKINGGIPGEEASLSMMDQVLMNQKYGASILAQMFQVSMDKTTAETVEGIFTGYETSASSTMNKYVVDLGPPAIPDEPVLAKPAADDRPLLDDGQFFDRAKVYMDFNSLDGFATLSFSKLVIAYAMKASDYKISTHVVTTPGKRIDDAILADPDATVIINGAMFNYIPNDGSGHSEPLTTMGVIMDDGGTPQPTSCDRIVAETRGCREVAKYRWWMGQTTAGGFEHGGRQILPFKDGHPPAPPGPPDLFTAVGGLYGNITDRVYLNPRTGLPDGSRRLIKPPEDFDLNFVYAPFSKIGASTPAKLVRANLLPFGGIVYDKETDILVVWARQYGAPDGIPYILQQFLNAGADWAVGTDSGGSTALAFQTASGPGHLDVAVRGRLHTFSPSANETVTNYIVFKKR
jgi:hypothetical protein